VYWYIVRAGRLWKKLQASVADKQKLRVVGPSMAGIGCQAIFLELTLEMVNRHLALQSSREA
jgi:hypothetical protein